MDIDGRLKAIPKFSNVCGSSPVNNQIIFFDGHDSHFNARALRHIQFRNSQHFVLKSGDSTNDKHNDNGPNDKLKYLYNIV